MKTLLITLTYTLTTQNKKNRIIFQQHLHTYYKYSGNQTNNVSRKILRISPSTHTPNHSNFLPILSALNAKLTNWKIKTFNNGWKNTLAKTIISSISMHIMQYHALPTKTTNAINKTFKILFGDLLKRVEKFIL